MLAELSTIAFFAVGLLLSVAGALAARKKNQPNDDRPETYASRGSFIPLVIGLRRVGAIVLWIQPDESAAAFAGNDSPTGGYGKGGASKALQGDNYEENGLHALCIGPASALHAIYQNGERIWQGPITPDTHPSGTTITTATEGTFKIYWGFQDDPIVQEINVAANFNVATRLPLVTKVLWQPKKLGTSRAWPRMEYDVEVPCYSVLATTAPIYGKYIDENIKAPLTWAQMASAGLANPLTGVLGGPVSTARCDFDVLAILDVSGPEADFILGLSSRFTTINQGYNTGLSQPDSWWRNNAGGQQPLANATIRKGDVMRIFGGSTSSGFPSTQPFNGTVANIGLVAPNYLPAGDFCKVVDVFPTPFYAWRVDTYNISNTLIGSEWFWSLTNPTIGPVGNLKRIGAVFYGATRLRLRFRSTVQRRSTLTLSSATYKAVKTEVLGVAGVNPAHMVSQLMFAPFPYGAHIDKRRFDMNSLEEVSEHFANLETYRGSLKAVDGEDVSNVLNRVLTDLGMFITWEPLLGKYVFDLIRNPDYNTATLHPEVKAEMLLELPEITNSQGSRTPDKVMVTFQDAERNFRENNVTFDDDGQASQEEVQYAERIEISTTTDYESAVLAGSRRQMEVVSNQSTINLKTNHATRWIYPGLVIRATAAIDDEIPLRVMSVKRSVNSSLNELECMMDNYDAPLPSSVDETIGIETDQPDGGLPIPVTPPIEDLSVGAFEVPKYLSSDAIRFFFPRLRGNTKSGYSILWLSRDDSSYFLETELSTPVAGGFLTAELGTAPAYSTSITSVKIYAGVADDLYEVEDLSSQDESYMLGRQVALIGNEICFVRRAAIQLDETWAIGEMVRGRLGTAITSHPAGTPVYIFRSHQIKQVSSLLFQPNRVCYAKLQPMGSTTGITLDNVAPIQFTVEGKALRPMPVGGVRLSNFRPTHARNIDVLVVWNYRSSQSPKTGMGLQGFGDPVGSSAIQGEFRVTIYDPAAPTTIVRQEIVAQPSYTYTSLKRAADGFNDASDEAWTISIENIEAGYASTPALKTFQAQA